jgi:DNA polymerase III alpha subunit
VPEEYADAAARLGMPAIALADRDGFYGSPRFFLAMKKLGTPFQTLLESSWVVGLAGSQLAANSEQHERIIGIP